MKFFRTIKKSIYDPSFYKTAVGTETKKAVSYFLKLILLLAVVQTLLLALPVFATLSELRTTIIPALISKYPANLTITLENGKASINQPEPYFFKIPANQRTQQSTTDNFLVIDTLHPFSEEAFNDYSTLLLMTENSIYYKQANTEGISSIPLNEVSNFSINRQFFNETLSKYSPLLKYGAPIVLLALFALMLMIYLTKLIYNFFLAGVLWIISRALNLNLTYKETYKIGLYAMTLSLLIEVLLRILTPVLHFPGFPFMGTIITSIVFIANFKKETKT